eukprot:scaffold79194_cov31-Tisochrysis_lutea.AAC.1
MESSSSPSLSLIVRACPSRCCAWAFAWPLPAWTRRASASRSSAAASASSSAATAATRASRRAASASLADVTTDRRKPPRAAS